MNAEELKQKIRAIFGSQIFFNKDFDDLAESIKNIDSNLIDWCLLLKSGKIQPLRSPKMPGNLVFIKRIGSSNRCLVIKMINGEFKEFHLGDHHYYDLMRMRLGLKESSL